MSKNRSTSPTSPTSPVTPVSPRDQLSGGSALRTLLGSAKPWRLWQPPIALGWSLTINCVMFTYIAYPEGGFSSLKAVPPANSDFIYALWFLVAFCLYRMVFNYHFSQPLAVWLGAPDVSNARKFSQQFMNLQFHSLSAIMLLFYYLPKQPYFYVIERIWETDEQGGWTNIRLEPEFMILYMAHIGYHMNSLIFHFTDEVRRDFLQMLVHHTATVALLLISFKLNLCRWGALVLLVSDASDVCGCITKMCTYTTHRRLALVTYPFLVIVWGYTRCWLLPFWIVRQVFAQSSFEHATGIVVWSTGILLVILSALNFFWFILLLRMGFTAIVKFKVTDLSEYQSPEMEAAILRTNGVANAVDLLDIRGTKSKSKSKSQ
eukprot:NODE_2970_length_1304_cov_231.419136_g2821_i0.p1 GENE.NODE_2970_length_1304_cov_231.419136_g2821_i0~~NODE_2970_length_1304_cov_231.419136_g2821_i0.p1  ORF type:complete len:376 (-),score=56.74 NODE_2970_length_1304_cov_231.419136_g2821_i0:112-1239(-)